MSTHVVLLAGSSLDSQSQDRRGSSSSRYSNESSSSQGGNSGGGHGSSYRDRGRAVGSDYSGDSYHQGSSSSSSSSGSYGSGYGGNGGGGYGYNEGRVKREGGSGRDYSRENYNSNRENNSHSHSHNYRQGNQSSSSSSYSQQPFTPAPLPTIAPALLENLEEGLFVPMIDFENPTGDLDSFVFNFERTCPETSPFDTKNHNMVNQKACVCKHWLRNLCKKGKLCEYRHVYIADQMPVCRFFSETGKCGNGEDCMFKHVTSEKQQECPWYSRGFCKHGRTCRNGRHTPKTACVDYMLGFCPKGSSCPDVHPRYDDGTMNLSMQPESSEAMTLPSSDDSDQSGEGSSSTFSTSSSSRNQSSSQSYNGLNSMSSGQSRGPFTCHYCKQPGHKQTQCPLKIAPSSSSMMSNHSHSHSHSLPSHHHHHMQPHSQPHSLPYSQPQTHLPLGPYPGMSYPQPPLSAPPSSKATDGQMLVCGTSNVPRKNRNV